MMLVPRTNPEVTMTTRELLKLWGGVAIVSLLYISVFVVPFMR